MHNSSRRDKGQLKAKKLKTVFIQHTVNKITLSISSPNISMDKWDVFRDTVYIKLKACNKARQIHSIPTCQDVVELVVQLVVQRIRDKSKQWSFRLVCRTSRRPRRVRGWGGSSGGPDSPPPEITRTTRVKQANPNRKLSSHLTTTYPHLKQDPALR